MRVLHLQTEGFAGVERVEAQLAQKIPRGGLGGQAWVGEEVLRCRIGLLGSSRSLEVEVRRCFVRIVPVAMVAWEVEVRHRSRAGFVQLSQSQLVVEDRRLGLLFPGPLGVQVLVQLAQVTPRTDRLRGELGQLLRMHHPRRSGNRRRRHWGQSLILWSLHAWRWRFRDGGRFLSTFGYVIDKFRFGELFRRGVRQGNSLFG